jgi:serine/threonine protein kinase
MGSDGPLPRPDAQWTDPQPAKADVIKSADEASMQRNNSLLACLSSAQFRNVDFTGISEVEGQGKLGDGGQSSVLQTRADATSVLAFRKNTPQKKSFIGKIYESFSKGASASVATSSEAYRQIASEILALGHPAIRSHQNIVQLIAISWEIREGTWLSKTEIWPVLIFEKAHYGDLENFVRDPKKILQSKDTLSTKNMMKICAEIASAMAVIHENSKIHSLLVFNEG